MSNTFSGSFTIRFKLHLLEKKDGLWRGRGGGREEGVGGVWWVSFTEPVDLGPRLKFSRYFQGSWVSLFLEGMWGPSKFLRGVPFSRTL